MAVRYSHGPGFCDSVDWLLGILAGLTVGRVTGLTIACSQTGLECGLQTRSFEWGRVTKVRYGLNGIEQCLEEEDMSQRRGDEKHFHHLNCALKTPTMTYPLVRSEGESGQGIELSE